MHPPSVLGGHCGHAVRRRLDDRQAKGLLQRDVDKHAARGLQYSMAGGVEGGGERVGSIRRRQLK